ncbi:hypothetical protein PTTG_06197 [Puccinia triticina 1-1 BBBD Race 1]|uniref:Proteasome assembly chaperone 1 n=2 Tax=Puccinia triticina TaxID=208348 RepID=A0A0C4EZD8_PUCT1|nr:uncharacterized protein PtA15_16A325 [Puccinia triticina]OAV93082.1 hypothetical protein PTTG_06197 [Puccinia triticina 1-1 BBBD Race 1]WAQ92417.1 hypothetical protein PtA15_16A325 [Puccinia triticina]
MATQILDFQHSTGPAPAYAIESDSEDDQWADEPAQDADGMTKSSELQGREGRLEWQPADPTGLEFPGQSGLLVLVGDAGLLVGSGLPDHLRSPSQPFFHLNQFLLLSQSARFVLTPRHVPLELQSALAQKLLADTHPPSLTIISTYQAPTYIPSSENYPIRYLASTVSDHSSPLPQALENLGCQHFQVPNLIKGFEAALIIQANILQIDSKVILLPAISIPHDEKSSTSIPTGQYDFSSAATGIGGSDSPGLPASLLALDDPGLRRTLGAVIDEAYLQYLRPPHVQAQHETHAHWRFPSALEPALRDSFRRNLNLDQQLKPKPNASATHSHELGLMYM